MNVLQIVNLASVYPGNLMASILKLEDEIRKDGNCFFVFPKEAEKTDWIKNWRGGGNVYFKSGSKLRDICMLIRLCRRLDIDIIHLHFWNIPDCLAIKCSKIFNRKLEAVIHHHSMYVCSSSKLREKIKRMILGGNFHIACSEGMFRCFKEWKFAPSKVFCVNNGVDIVRLEEKEDVSWEGNNILMFSSCGCEIKGIDIASRAIWQLVEKGVQVNLVIVCSQKQDEVENFIKRTLQREMPTWVRFMPPRNDVATYYSSATAFLSASRSEGFCLAVVEAAYCGCESIQSRIPGHRLDIPECKTFESENVKQLAECIEAVLAEDIQERQRICKLQREYVIKQYGVERWVDGVMTVYHKMMGE